jgi:hypothetical protein
MQTNQIKIESSNTLCKVLLVKQISTLNGKEFDIQLQRANLYYQASENFKLQSTKDELNKLNVTFKDKYDYFEQMFNTAKSQSAKLIRIGALDTQIIADYKEKYKSKCTLDGLDNLRKADKESNTTKEGISENSETEKPSKFSTTKKGIDIKINSGVTADDIKEAIKYLKGLDIK